MRIKIAVFVAVAFVAAMLGVNAKSPHRHPRSSFVRALATTFDQIPHDCATLDALHAASGIEGGVIGKTKEAKASLVNSGLARREIKKAKTMLRTLLKRDERLLDATTSAIADLQNDVGVCQLPTNSTGSARGHVRTASTLQAADAPPSFEPLFADVINETIANFGTVANVLPFLTSFINTWFIGPYADLLAFVCAAGAFSAVTCALQTPTPTPTATPTPTPTPTPSPTPTVTPSENEPPVVDAGPDRTTGIQTELHGSVTDATLPNGPLVITWSGPPGVDFDAPTQADTGVTFPGAGTYVVRLTASDGELSAFDEATITVVVDG